MQFDTYSMLLHYTYDSRHALDSAFNTGIETPPGVLIKRPLTIEDAYFISTFTGDIFYRAAGNAK